MRLSMIDVDVRTLHDRIGQEIAVSDWLEVSQARIEQSCREHGLMIDALAARDAAGLAKLVALHIRQLEEGAVPRRRRSA